jgi:hypothetical protein
VACWKIAMTEALEKKRTDDFARLRTGLASGAVGVRLGPSGALTFTGWKSDLLADSCAYRRLTQANDPNIRQAIVRAEALAGRKLNEQAVLAGVHSHDGGRTWSAH